MNELHKQIRKDAEALLDKLVTDIENAAIRLYDANGVSANWLLRLASGTRTESLRKKAIGVLAAKREQELLALYQKKPELKAVGGKE